MCDEHLGVVVGGEVGLAVHRQPADEVRQPHVRRALELRVLVQEVVELPRLVADPQVVVLGLDDVVEDHEVRDQDLVHPAPGLEAVQVVLGRLGLHVRGLVGQVPAGGVDALALGLEHAGDRVLGEPVDVEVRVQPAQLLGDRDVAPRVAEADRGGDEQRAAAPGATTLRPCAARELVQEPVDLDRLARLRAVAGAGHRHQAAAGGLRQRRALGVRADQVLVAVDHQHRALHAGHRVLEGLEPAQRERRHRVRERLRVGLQRPAHAVLDLLGRVRVVEHLGEEELQEAAVVLAPVVAVVHRPGV